MNSPIAVRITGRRPKRSDNRPYIGMTTVEARMKPVMTHVI